MTQWMERLWQKDPPSKRAQLCHPLPSLLMVLLGVDVVSVSRQGSPHQAFILPNSLASFHALRRLLLHALQLVFSGYSTGAGRPAWAKDTKTRKVMNTKDIFMERIGHDVPHYRRKETFTKETRRMASPIAKASS
ncbi:hypothetical protein GW17_00039075 [Ensete ventricosum]|nr:hypothetical protein GW17_00039075 [Ensete ventricosum]